jgi:predicted nucleotidyltransferase/DNA-binding HxlR family transcriptional regulator
MQANLKNCSDKGRSEKQLTGLNSHSYAFTIQMTTLQTIVSSRGKAEIFRILFGISHPELHLREIARQAGLSLGTIQQELRTLMKAGIVRHRKSGNRVYFRANDSHPLHGDLTSLVLKTSGLVEVLQPALSDKQIDIAFVFGSVARGETRAESDVDLMIIGPIGLRRVTQLIFGLSGTIGREINPQVLPPEEFAKRKERGDHFVMSVLAGPRLFVKGSERELAAMGQ